MRWALQAEWLKLRTVVSTPLLLLGTLVLTAGLDAISIAATRCAAVA